MTESEILEMTGAGVNIEHAAWPAFVEQMRDKLYGFDALWYSWLWFQEGWDAALARRTQ